MFVGETGSYLDGSRVRAEQTPGGSWRLPADQFDNIRPGATTQLKAQLLARAADGPTPTDEELTAETLARRRS